MPRKTSVRTKDARGMREQEWNTFLLALAQHRAREPLGFGFWKWIGHSSQSLQLLLAHPATPHGLWATAKRLLQTIIEFRVYSRRAGAHNEKGLQKGLQVIYKIPCGSLCDELLSRVSSYWIVTDWCLRQRRASHFKSEEAGVRVTAHYFAIMLHHHSLVALLPLPLFGFDAVWRSNPDPCLC